MFLYLVTNLQALITCSLFFFLSGLDHQRAIIFTSIYIHKPSGSLKWHHLHVRNISVVVVWSSAHISLKFYLVDILKLQSLKGGGKAYIIIECKPKINRPNGIYQEHYACTVWNLYRNMIHKIKKVDVTRWWIEIIAFRRQEIGSSHI